MPRSTASVRVTPAQASAMWREAMLADIGPLVGAAPGPCARSAAAMAQSSSSGSGATLMGARCAAQSSRRLVVTAPATNSGWRARSRR